MAYEIPDHFHSLFTSNVELLLQQKTPYLAGTVSMGAYSGQSAQVVKQFGTVEFEQRSTRHADTLFSDIEHRQRWIFPLDYSLALPVDKEDEIRMLGSPLSPYAEAMRAAWARKWDEVVIDAFFATAKTGVNGGTNTTYPATYTVAVGAGASAATGLNTEKLIQARKFLQANEVDLRSEMPYVAVTAAQLADLLRSVETTSAEYSNARRLETGEIDSFMGFRFVRTEQLDVDGSGYRRLPVWVPSGMHVGMWNNLETRIGERPDKQYLTQVFMRGSVGATRLEEKKVVEIKCAE